MEKFFTEEELQPCRDAIADMVEMLANKLYEAGKIKSKSQPKVYMWLPVKANPVRDNHTEK